MKTISLIIAAVEILVGMLILTKQVWKTEFKFTSIKIYISILCALVVSASIYSEVVSFLRIFEEFSTSSGFVQIINIVSGLAPIAGFIPVGRYAAKKETEQVSPFMVVFQTLIIMLISAIAFAFNNPSIVFLSSIISILTLVCFVIRGENKYYNSVTKINNDMLEAQLQHYEVVNQSNFELRRIKHDMKNHLFVLKELASSGSVSELQSYVDDLLGSIAASETFYRTGNEIVDAIISDKTARAAKRGIKLEVSGNMVGCEINSVDLCTIIANLLDNAIEAVSKLYGMDTSPEHNVITLDFKKNANFLLVTQKNYALANMRHSASGVVSSKGGIDHGFGLYNIKNAVARNGGEFSVSVVDEKFYRFEFEIMLPMSV